VSPSERPDWSWAAPGRVNLMGEHTDYNDGFVLPFAIEQRTRVALRRRADGRLRIHSTQQDGTVETTTGTTPGEVSGWAGYVAGVVWALRDAGHDVPGADLWIDSDVPMGAGLSSSAALTCATTMALDDLAGAGLDAAGIAELALLVENDYVGAPTGVMDQLASVHGRAGQAMLIDTRSLTVEHRPARFVDDGFALLVIDTGAAHALAEGGAYAERRRECERAAELLGFTALRDVTERDLARLDHDVLRRRARHVVTEDARVLACAGLLGTGDWAAVGAIFSASHASMRDDFEISCAELDVACSAAEAGGALGSRMTGGGFGGAAIALLPQTAVGSVAASVRAAFAAHGWPDPRVLAVQPSAGAGPL